MARFSGRAEPKRQPLYCLQTFGQPPRPLRERAHLYAVTACCRTDSALVGKGVASQTTTFARRPASTITFFDVLPASDVRVIS
jgi:hypothetical protein